MAKNVQSGWKRCSRRGCQLFGGLGRARCCGHVLQLGSRLEFMRAMGVGVDLDPIESGSRKRRERPGQSEAACMLGNGVDAAPKESEDVAEQVMSATLHTASTRCAPPLDSCGSTDFVL